MHDVVGSAPSDRSNFRWETISTVVYVAGGALFIWGSVLFFPGLDRSDRGALIFIIGSLLYLLVTGHDMAEVAKYRASLDREPTIWDRLEAWASLTYVVGSVLFVVGSVCFLSVVGWLDAGSWCFIVGSVLFVVAAMINVLQIVEARDMRTLQLQNLTALMFVTGSVLFAVASIPYLFTVDPGDERVIDNFLASQYVVGSVLFLAGGLFNYRRAYIVAERQADDGP